MVCLLAVVLCAGVARASTDAPARTTAVSTGGDVLGRALPAEPMALLGAAQELSATGLYDDAAAVTRLAERNSLLVMTGRAPVPAANLRSALRAADSAEPPINGLRDEVLGRVSLRIPATLAGSTIQPMSGTDAATLTATGGAWTSSLLLDRRSLIVPIEATFTGKAGAIGGLSGKITLQPKRSGRPIILLFNANTLTGDRYRHDVPFWIAARVAATEPPSDTELRAALAGLTSGGTRSEPVVQVGWLTASEDPRAPFLIVSRDRAPIVDDRFRQIVAPGAAGGVGALAGADVPAQCQVFAAGAEAKAPTRGSPATRVDRERPPIPLTTPLMQSVLARPMASDAATLLDLRALFAVAQHAEEAGKLERLAERGVLLAVLGQRVEPQGTVGAALSAAAPSDAELAILRNCVIRTAVGIDLVNMDSTHGVDFFGRPYQHDAPRAVIQSQTSEAALTVPLEVVNRSAARLAEFEFTVRLTPADGGEPVILRVDRSGGSALGDRAHVTVNARLTGASSRIDATTLDGVLAATRRGDYRADIGDWTLVYQQEPRFRLSPGDFAWLDPDDRDTKAMKLLASASCTDTASCSTARSGRGLSSAYTWVTIELLAAIGVPLLVARRRSPRRAFAWVYAVYTVAAIGSALLLRIDPPTGSGLSGVLSVGAAFMLGLPWPLVLTRVPPLISGLNGFFLSADAGLVLAWIGIAFNHGLLGFLAFRSRDEVAENAGN